MNLAALKFLLAMFLSAYIPIILFSKMLHYLYDFMLIDFITNTVYIHASIFIQSFLTWKIM